MAKTTTIQKNSTLENAIFVGLCALLFIAPFFRGLFFEKELLPTHLFSFILCIIWVIVNFKNKEHKIIKTPTDILALGVVFMYLISTFYAVNTRLAILEALKHMNYFVIYLLARDIIKDEKRRKIILNVLIASAFIVSIIGIGSAIGTWNYNGAFVSNRINSTFQYPNTLASYLVAIFIITISMILNVRNKKIKSIYGFISSTMLLTFILTYSRGMWLIFPFILLLYIILMPNDRKLELFINLGINVMIPIPLAFLFTKYLDTKPNFCWVIVIGVGLLSSILTYLMSNLQERIKHLSIKKILISLLIVFIGLSAFTLFSINSTTALILQNNTDKNQWTSFTRGTGNIEPNTDYKININYDGKIKEDDQYAGRVVIQSIDKDGKTKSLKDIRIKDINKNEITETFATDENTDTLKIVLQNYYKGTSITFNEVEILDDSNNLVKNIPLKYKYIPESIVSRINSINLKENSAQVRIAFYNDAMKVIKDYFLFGVGGGGWLSLYKMYQSYGYESTQAHNYFLQLCIEVGIIGLLLFVAFIIFISLNAYRSYKRSSTDNKLLIAGVYTAVLSILFHAFMDFDLSLCALTFVLWLLFGILSSLDMQTIHEIKINRYVRFGFIAILSILIFISSSFIVAPSYAKKAVKSYEKGNIRETIKYFETASKLYPYNSKYKIDLANMYKQEFKESKNNESILKSIKLMDRAFELSKYDSKHIYTLIPNITNFFFSIGDVEKGLDYIDEIVYKNPMNSMSYLIKSKGYLQVIQYYLNQKKDIDKAKEVIERAYKIKDEIKQANEVALKPLKYNEDLLYNIGFIQFYYENLEKSDYPMDKDYALKFAYYFDLDIDKNEIIDKLKTWNSKEGQVNFELKKDKDSFIRITNDGNNYGIVYPNGMKLKPDTNYKISFKSRGTVKDNTFRFHLIDNKSSKKNQGGLARIELKDDWQIFSCKIKTTSDIDTEAPYLGFYHYGNDEGYIDIEEVVIFEER